MEQNELQQVGEQVTKAQNKLRGNRSIAVDGNTTATKAEVSEILGNVLHWYDKKPVKSDEECASRLNEFFQHLQQTGEIPTVEKMCLALGVTRASVWNWETGGDGSTAARKEMIKKAKEILAAMDAELVSKGKIPQITYIFRAKNFFGMADKQEVVITPNNPLGDKDDQKRLEARYLESAVEE